VNSSNDTVTQLTARRGLVENAAATGAQNNKVAVTKSVHS
jgi:hypothetical protein